MLPIAVDTLETEPIRRSNFTPGRVAIVEGLAVPPEVASWYTQYQPNQYQPAAQAQGTNPSIDYQTELQLALQPIARQLIDCEQLLKESLTSQQTDTHEMLQYVQELGGKRLRPALLLLASHLFGPITKEAIRLAAVVELVHTATLVHDDILDNANVRRHRTTLHKHWNVPSAVLAGDWLFTQAYNLANMGESTIPGRWIAFAAKSVCEGEIHQSQSAGREVNYDDYIQMLAGKTGALCAISCGLGAWAGGAEFTDCEKLYQYGMKLGIAFQIHDDWLDIWGDTSVTGKASCADLQSKKWTLPLIRFRATASQTQVDKLAKLMQAESIDHAAILKLIETSDAKSYTQQVARDYIEQAIDCLNEVARTSHLDANQGFSGLQRLAQAAIRRVR
jgi:octaprenyl-diphosphate synthase